MDSDWKAIRPLHGDKAKGFQELCVQSARSEGPANAEFIPKGNPDAGVETYCVLDDGRLLVLSPFPATARRPTAALAAQRNCLVACLAAQVFLVEAAAGSMTEAFARKLAESGKPLLTLDSPTNKDLAEMGSEIVETEHNLREQDTIERLRRDNSLYY